MRTRIGTAQDSVAGAVLVFTAWICCACGVLPVEGTTLPPTAPSTLPAVVDALSSYSAEARIAAALALSKYGKEAVVAVPALIQNLYYESTPDVRRAAAIALGELGPDGQSAVPDLIHVLQADEAVQVRISAAEALGQIRAPSSVPTLAAGLYEESTELTIVSSVSIALITGARFPDAHSEHGYRLNEEGVPLIVVSARRWWEQEGKSQNWQDRNN